MGEQGDVAVPRPDWSTRWHELRHDRRVAAGLLACVALAAGAAWVRAGAGASPASVPAGPAPAR
ncbi:MAG TPA: hypothetical protein VN636_02510, partial [Acidimicrobiia bacterium]|nr:hypothetical protein [Acidimicrobiia bacterium]